MVAYAYAASYPDKVERLVVMDAPIPGIDPWNEILLNPGVWHFNFRGPDAERLVAGRERIYFDRIWNDFTGDPGKPDEATRSFFAATYAQPGGMRAGFAQFAAFSQDAKDNKVFEQTKLTIPVMAVGGEKSFGPMQAVIMRHVATNVQGEVVAGSGHWLMEERPAYTVALIRKFLDGPPVAHPVASSADGGANEERLTPTEYKFPQVGNPGTGSSGVGGIQTVVLNGNPDQAGVISQRPMPNLLSFRLPGSVHLRPSTWMPHKTRVSQASQLESSTFVPTNALVSINGVVPGLSASR
jgi:hypothetical protein